MLPAVYVLLLVRHAFQHAKFNFGMIPGRRPAKHAMLIAGTLAYEPGMLKTAHLVTTCSALPVTISTLGPKPSAPPASQTQL